MTSKLRANYKEEQALFTGFAESDEEPSILPRWQKGRSAGLRGDILATRRGISAADYQDDLLLYANIEASR